jgi:hypothetical protein
MYALVLVALSAAASSNAQDKAAGSDAVQAFQSPLQIGSGATLLISQEKTSFTAAFGGQRPGTKGLNIWQIGLTGTTNDEGKALVFSTADPDAPGFKLKIGVGHSSFLTADTKGRDEATEPFMNQAWCLDTLREISKGLPKPVERAKGQQCMAYFSAVQQSFSASPPPEEDAAKAAKAVLDTLSPIAADVTLENRTAACKSFEKTAKSVFKFCPASGTAIKSVNDQQKEYEDLYAAMVHKELPSFYYTVTGNYQPTLTSTAYREKVNGVTDLETKHEWTRLLNRASLDTALYYRRLAAGVQLAYGETADIKLSHVCKVETNGDYRAETCKDAMLGRPDPDKSYSLTTVLAVDPLILPNAGTLLRPGAQLEIRYEQPSRGNGHKSEVAIPLYLAPVQSPLKLVVGVRPTWTHDTTGDDPDRHFSIFFFIGARPGLGS